MTPPRPRLATFAAPTGSLVTFADPPAAPLAASPADRTIAGLVVPFGPAGRTAAGLLSFRPGSLTWAADVRRVKLLREHDQRDAVGHAVALEERPDGVWGTFRVPDGEDGDRALRDVAEGLRDGLSVGVMLDAATEARLRRAQPGTVVAAAGLIRETSMVSVPAFDDARAAGTMAAASSGGLVTMTTPSDPSSGSTPPPPAPVDPTPPAPPADPPGPPAPPPVNGTTNANGHTTGTAPVTPMQRPAAAPRVGAGAASITAQAATYTLDGRGPSLVRDAYAARFDGDPDAAARLRRFNAELAGGNQPSIMAFASATVSIDHADARGLTTFAVGDPIDSPALTTDTNIPSVFLPAANRPDLMIAAVDRGRPIVSRLNRVTINNAQPFLIPLEGEFDGVADHVEGTAHVAEGTLTLNDAPVMPKAVSGAYRVSRELVDSTNPVIDRIALRAMLRDYRRLSESKVVAALTAADAAPTFSVNTTMELRAALVAAVNDDDEPMDFVAASPGLLAALYAEVDTTGRPILALSGQAPTAGTARAGYTGLGVDGTEVVRASRLAAGTGFLIREAGVLFAESTVQQFRFDQVEGPGLLKLALWAYVAAAVLRADDVVQITTAAS